MSQASPTIEFTVEPARHANDQKPTIDLNTMVRVLREDLAKATSDVRPAEDLTNKRGTSNKGRLPRAELLAHNFPIALPYGSRSLFRLFDPMSLTSSAAKSHAWRERFFFREAPSPSCVTSIGLGASEVLVTSGEGRFDRMRELGESLLSTVQVIDHASLKSWPGNLTLPRLFGGFSFAPGSASSGVWKCTDDEFFGDARFVLPKITLRRSEGSLDGVLTIVTPVRQPSTTESSHPDLIQGIEIQVIEALDKILQWVRKPPGHRAFDIRATDRCPGTSTTLVSNVEAKIDQALQSIEDGVAAGKGLVEKIVIAQHHDLELNLDIHLKSDREPEEGDQELGPSDPAELLGRLDHFAEGGSIFAVATGATVFLGAPPERLIAARGGRVETEAVAGSRPRKARSGKNLPSHSPFRVAGPRLVDPSCFQATDKDLREHQIVVEHVVAALSPSCTNLEAPNAPLVRAHPALFHLETPVKGHLKPGVHVLDLASSLHPTPAVCGTPQKEALQLLQQIEDTARGWYAGPVGWFDGLGDGEFAVALRCAILTPKEARLFAGAGIVSGSVPCLEAREIARKLVPMTRVLAPYLAEEAPFPGQEALKSWSEVASWLTPHP